MNNQASRISTGSVPHIVVTEPSPVANTTQSTVSVPRKMESIPDTVSIARKIEPIPEMVANGSGGASGSVRASLEQASAKVAGTNATATSSESNKSCESEEFRPAQECNDCIVPLPEQSASQSVENSATTSSTEPEQDNFRTADVGCCSTFGLKCIDYYEKVWKIIHSGYAIPFWCFLMALPVSAGYMSSLYMYSCPASHSMPMIMFTIGISLMAVLSLRVCLIIRRMTATAEDDLRNMLHTLLLISSFLTVVFFLTESVLHWKMTSTLLVGTPEYCDPNFLNFSFWWNCAMFVAIVPIFLFPA